MIQKPKKPTGKPKSSKTDAQNMPKKSVSKKTSAVVSPEIVPQCDTEPKKGGAPKGNQFWLLRSRHGRKKLFETPELLWEAACEYFQWCEDNPWAKVETTVKSDKTEVKTIPTARPYTIEGFCLYCDASKTFWKEFKKANHEGFLSVTTRIDEIIYRQKFEGAAVGCFNANIIARDLGLADKKEVGGPDGGPLLVELLSAIPAEMRDKIKEKVLEKLSQK